MPANPYAILRKYARGGKRVNPAWGYRQLLFAPERLLQRAVAGGFLSLDAASSPRVEAIAEDVAEDWTHTWPEGEGFGSSDFTAALRDFLEAVGVKTHYVDGRLAKKNPGRKKRKNPVDYADLAKAHGGRVYAIAHGYRADFLGNDAYRHASAFQAALPSHLRRGSMLTRGKTYATVHYGG